MMSKLLTIIVMLMNTLNPSAAIGQNANVKKNRHSCCNGERIWPAERYC